MVTLFANSERQFRAIKYTSPISVHNIYSFYESESSESESEDVEGVDIETVTLEQYLALNNTNRRINKLEDTTFEIKGQFLKELCKTTFSGNTTENAIEHIEKETVDKETTMAEQNEYITATRKNFISNDNEGRMVEKYIVEIQGTFLVKIRNDTFYGNDEENAYEHINKFLKIVEPIKINGLTQDRFRLSIFPVSLAGAAYECDMSNSDELRHSDNTTQIPLRLPDTLPQVYHRRRPTLGLLILPSVLPFPPTIRRTARMSVLPIEPNLAERARISAINLDDYQLDPVTPPPSPSSPFTMAAYQRMIAETDPTQREEALTETGQNSVPVPETALTVCTTRLRGQLHTILEDMDRYPNACLEELEAFMTLWDVKPRVEESSLETLSVDELISQLRQMCEDAEDRASNAQEEARQKRKEALEEVVQ
ncbi:hypothetical protein Tco_0617930 [Tanacetum coccineum]